MLSNSFTRRLGIGLLLVVILGLLVVQLLQRVRQRLLSINPTAATQVRESRYDPAPAPENINTDEVNARLQRVKNSLFFLDTFCFFGKVKVQVDSFLLPNAQYAKMTFNWKTLVSTTGANVLRQPTDKELKKENTFHQDPCIYCTDEQARPARAMGSVQLQIPVKFAHVTFAAKEVKTTRRDGPLEVTLQSCVNDTISLKLKGKIKADDVIFVMRDAAGGRLAMEESSSSSLGGSTDVQYKVAGTIANVELYTPTEYASNTFDVLATREPEAFGGKTIDVKAPRYTAPGVAVEAAEYDLAGVKAKTSIVAGRSYAMMGYNTPEIIIKLPHTLNSVYSTVDFGKPKLTDAAGKAVAYKPELSLFEIDSFSNEIRFNEAKGAFAFADGTVHLRYPAKLKLVTLTSAKPSNGTLQARFDGALVKVNTEVTSTDSFIPDNLAGVRAYDASGYQLKKLSYFGNEIINNVNYTSHAFWGKPTEIRVVTVEKWLTLDIPYHLPPAAKLPADQVGQKPANE